MLHTIHTVHTIHTLLRTFMRQLATVPVGAVPSGGGAPVFPSEASAAGGAAAPCGSVVVTMTDMTATGDGETPGRSALCAPLAGLPGEGAPGGTGARGGALHAGSGARENASVSVSESGRSWPWGGGAVSPSSQAPPGCGASPALWDWSVCGEKARTVLGDAAARQGRGRNDTARGSPGVRAGQYERHADGALSF